MVIPPGILSGLGLSPEQEFNGVDFIISIIFTAGSEEIRSFKRIKISSNPIPNNNPQLDNILIDQSSTLAITDGVEVDYDITPGFEEENYTFFDQDLNLQNATEEYLVTWFVAGGILALSRTDRTQTNTFNTDPAFPGTPFLVGVLRDNRGGQSILIRQ